MYDQKADNSNKPVSLMYSFYQGLFIRYIICLYTFIVFKELSIGYTIYKTHSILRR